MSRAVTADIAVALLRGVDYAQVQALGMTAPDVIALSDGELASMMQMLPDEVRRMRREALEKARREAEFVLKKHLKILTPLHQDYPRRLLMTFAPPRMLSVCGGADLNAARMISMVGTRRATPYGLAVTESLVAGLHDEAGDVSVVSGLAYGIDAASHLAALKNGMTTIGVVGHGLGMIYPAAHRDLAARIVAEGGAIVSAYLHDVKPFRSHFLERNLVIAGLSDAVIVVESALKGGALSTAAGAAEIGRHVFAVPGRITDEASAGTNHLIATGRAEVATTPADIVTQTGWQKIIQREGSGSQPQPGLFEKLPPEQEKIVMALRTFKDPVSIDTLVRLTELPTHVVLSATSEMEFCGILLRWPGSRYQLVE